MNHSYNITKKEIKPLTMALLSLEPYLQGISLIYYSQGSLNGYGHSELD